MKPLRLSDGLGVCGTGLGAKRSKLASWVDEGGEESFVEASAVSEVVGDVVADEEEDVFPENDDWVLFLGWS
jgi:hypothetical protein